MADRYLFACGGGGFFENERMRKAILDMSGKAIPRLLYIPTASGDSKEAVTTFSEGCRGLGLGGGSLELFRSRNWSASPLEMIEAADVIWVGGGSTFNMLKLWDAWRLVPALRAAYERGVALGGVSAGAICWFEQGNTDSLGPGLNVLDGLGWLPGSCTPHYDSEEERKPALARQLREGRILPGIAIDENCTVRYRNGEVEEVISDRKNAWAYLVDTDGPTPHPSP